MSKTVTVGCKLPHGLILTVDGVNVEIAGRNSSRIISNDATGFTDIDSDFWTAWLSANKDRKAVVNGLIFANASEKSTKAEAKEKAKTKTGTEQIKADKKDGLEVV